MTCIIGFKHKGTAYIGADSLGSNGHTKAVYDTPKLFERHGILFGYTTTYRFGQILQHHLPEVVSKLDGYAYIVQCIVPAIRSCLAEHGAKGSDKGIEFGGEAILGYKGEIYRLQNDFSVLRHTNGIAVVGSGTEVATGAMMALKGEPMARIREALRITSDVVTTVGGPFVIERVPA
jgi:hypothetical protein